MHRHIRTVIVSVLAIALFGWFLRSADFGAVFAAVKRARPDFIGASLVMVVVTYWVRVVRWQYLLAPLGPTRMRTAFRTTVIGFAASSLLPARPGDVLRPYLLAKQEGLKPTSTFATIVLERVLDLVAVLVLLAIYAWGGAAATVPESLLRPVQVSATIAGVVAIALMALLFVLASHPERVASIVMGLSRVLPHRIAAALSGFARTFSEGLSAAKTPRPLVLALIWSFPLWVAIALEAWCVTRAFDINMSIPGTFLLQALLVIGVAVPTPGAVGGFHEAYRVGVTLFFGASNDAAIAAAIVLHAVSFVPVTIVGVIFMVGDGMSVSGLRGLTHVAAEAERPDAETQNNEVPVLRSSRR